MNLVRTGGADTSHSYGFCPFCPSPANEGFLSTGQNYLLTDGQEGS